MSNYHTLTKRVDHGELLAQLISGGVTSDIAIDDEKIYLTSDLDAPTMAAQLVIVATVEAAHQPSTCTEVTLAAAPHVKKLCEECEAAAGITGIGVVLPTAYPGTVCFLHESIPLAAQDTIRTTALAHDASGIPSLSVDTAASVIAADGVATGTVTVTDSRAAGASGLTVRLRIPSGGSAGANGDSFVLDGAGQATVTFQATTVFTGVLTFEFYYDTGEADPVTFTVRRGTA
jgi:hypothetical protein